MKTTIPLLCLYTICILFFAWAMPTAYTLLFEKELAKTHIFYSPTTKKVIYTEQIRIRDLKAEEKSEGHHADIVYKDEDDNYFTRLEFEEQLPFIYFRNMAMRGLLPMTIDNQSFDSAAIQNARRVLDLPARRLDNKMPTITVYPMIESNPDQVALVLPADRFRMTSDALEFIDSDLNSVDVKQTKEYTNALLDQGFVFPAQGVWGNFTTFKPYEAGVFITDAQGKTYHVMRYNNEPIVNKVSFDNNIIPQKILISENKDKLLYGLLLDMDNKVYLFHTKDYGLTNIPTPLYTPETMDIKILMDPMYMTIIYSDDSDAHIVVYDSIDLHNACPHVSKVHEYTHRMSTTQETSVSTMRDMLFPFNILLESNNSSKGVFNITLSAHYLTYCLPFNILLAMMYLALCRRKKLKNTLLECSTITILGIYVLIPMLLLEQYQEQTK